jgi:hypothetical protein
MHGVAPCDLPAISGLMGDDAAACGGWVPDRTADSESVDRPARNAYLSGLAKLF